jgi:hypothetical protein
VTQEYQDQSNHATGEDREQLARIEAKLGIPIGYYLSLRQDGTDWEFAIKLVVLLEAALGRVIAEHLHNSAINDHCESLNMGGRTGKVALAKALGIIGEAEHRTFLTLTEIRNAFAHRVENIAGNLHEFGGRLEPRRLEQFLKSCLTVPEQLEDKVSFLWRNPSPALLRTYMWMGGNNLLISLAYQDQAAEKERVRRYALESASGPTSVKPFSLADLFPNQGPTLLTASPDELKKMLNADRGTK